MIGEPLIEISITGEVSTNSSRQTIGLWKDKLEENFSILSSSPTMGKKLAVEMKFWIASKRLNSSSKNDVDNLVKPVLDAMKRMGIINDDAWVFHLKVTKFPTSGPEQLVMMVWEWVS